MTVAEESAMSMGPVPIAMNAVCIRPLLLHRAAVANRMKVQASVREREPIGERVTTGTKANTDPKDLLQDLQRLREQRARLRTELTSKEQKLRARANKSPPSPQHTVDAHADEESESGNDEQYRKPRERLPLSIGFAALRHACRMYLIPRKMLCTQLQGHQ